jgi:hypothetical protein
LTGALKNLDGGKTMKLKEYFAVTKGRGVLATSDSEGRVDAAVYARPHILDGETIAFIMADRLTHQNLQSNPKRSPVHGRRRLIHWQRFFLTRRRKEEREIDDLRRSYEE